MGKKTYKDSLLKYLCMALPYGVKVHIIGVNDAEIDDALTTATINHLDEWTVKPYLRPMSSMTESERKILSSMSSHSINCLHRLLNYSPDWYYLIYNEVDWLLENHFDFMGLIPMECAIEVTEDNNPYKD